MNIYHDFDALRHRTKIQCTLTLKSGMRVGKGRVYDALISDLPVQESHGVPMIPGSSLKGVFRSSAEKLLRGLSHALLKNEDEDTTNRIITRVAADPLNQKEGLNRSNKDQSQEDFIKDNVCMITATYGGMGLSSHVRFCDSLAQKDSFRVQKRDGVAINRDLGRVHGNAKYDYEVIEPHASFPIEIVLENDQDWQLELILSTLDMLEDGLIRIGGFTSRGLGRVHVEHTRVHRASLRQLLKKEEGDEINIDQLFAKNQLEETLHAWVNFQKNQ